MKKWPRLSQLFALHPFTEDETAPAGTLAPESQSAEWQKIRFDNTVRLWIAIPIFVACFFLWVQGVVASLIPIGIVFGCYAVVQFFLNWYFIGSRYARPFGFVLSAADIV